jgi:hypothetical protein
MIVLTNTSIMNAETQPQAIDSTRLKGANTRGLLNIIVISDPSLGPMPPPMRAYRPSGVHSRGLYTEQGRWLEHRIDSSRTEICGRNPKMRPRKFSRFSLLFPPSRDLRRTQQFSVGVVACLHQSDCPRRPLASVIPACPLGNSGYGHGHSP